MTDDHAGDASLARRMRRELLGSLAQSSTVDEAEFSLFRWYVTETEGQIAAMLVEEEAFVEEQIGKGDPEPNDSGFVAIQYYATRVRYSHIIQLVSLLESCLGRACEKLVQIIGKAAIAVHHRQIKGDQWTARRAFLEGHGHFTVPEERRQPVRILISARNAVVHQGGAIDDVTQTAVERLLRTAGVTLANGNLVFSQEFTMNALEEVQKYVSYIDNELAAIAARAIKPRPVA